MTTWPANRRRHTFKDLLADRADLEPRRTFCGFCGKSSPVVDGPTGRAWFKAHKCNSLEVVK